MIPFVSDVVQLTRFLASKADPYHDDHGRFATASAGHYGSAEESDSGGLAGSDEERNTHLLGLYKKMTKGLSREQKNAIVQYTSSLYDMFNRSLREKTALPAKYAQMIKAATEGLNRGEAPVAFSVSRGIKLPDEATAKSVFQELERNVGKSFTDPAFVSTTSDDESSFGDTMKFVIHVPKGAKGLYVESISEGKDEHEFLIPPGSKFKVLGTGKNQYGIRTVTLGLAKSENEKKKYLT